MKTGLFSFPSECSRCGKDFGRSCIAILTYCCGCGKAVCPGCSTDGERSAMRCQRCQDHPEETTMGRLGAELARKRDGLLAAAIRKALKAGAARLARAGAKSFTRDEEVPMTREQRIGELEKENERLRSALERTHYHLSGRCGEKPPQGWCVDEVVRMLAEVLGGSARHVQAECPVGVAVGPSSVAIGTQPQAVYVERLYPPDLAAQLDAAHAAGKSPSELAEISRAYFDAAREPDAEPVSPPAGWSLEWVKFNPPSPALVGPETHDRAVKLGFINADGTLTEKGLAALVMPAEPDDDADPSITLPHGGRE